jgi:cytochrome P450
MDRSKEDTTKRFIATSLLLNEDTFLGRQLSEDEAVEEAMGITFAGSGTTSTTLLYLLYNRSRPENLQFQLKLREERRSVGESLNEVKDLTYLNAVIKETMRLNSTIISTLPRVLEVPIIVPKAGLSFRKGLL